MGAKFQINDIVRVTEHLKPDFVGIEGAVTDITCLNISNGPRVYYNLRPIYPDQVGEVIRVPEDFLEAI